jgi:membrane AbrB-like protein
LPRAHRSRLAVAADWAIVVGATAGGGWLAGRAGLPSGYLFAAMLVGLAYALLAPGRFRLPRAGFQAGQAVTGVAIGTFLQSGTLTGLGSRWIPVVLVSIATLAVTIAAGLLLARVAGLDRPTASLGMVAGGASGIVAMAEDLGGDDRLVAFMQYLRVLIISLLTPLLVPLVFPGAHSAGGAGGASGPLLGSAAGWALTIGAALVGGFLAERLRIPAPMLLGPLLITAVLTLTGAVDVTVPPLLREAAFSVIGLYIGLGFERDTLRQIARLIVPVLVSIFGLLVACLGLAWLLTITADVHLLDAYLATTPGGLYAVLPIAYGSGADTTFVLAVQGLRLFAMILAAPIVVRWLVRSGDRRAMASSAP